jgi:hypothetical protein
MELAHRELDQAVVRRLERARRRCSSLLVAEGRTALLGGEQRSIFAAARVELDEFDHEAAWSALPAAATDRPQPVALYGFETITIGSDASLRVSGPPVILVVDHLTIESGGALYVHSLTRMLIGTLQRNPEPTAGSFA